MRGLKDARESKTDELFGVKRPNASMVIPGGNAGEVQSGITSLPGCGREPGSSRVPGSYWEGRGIRGGKMAPTVVQKYGHHLMLPGGTNDQVESRIAIYVSGGQFQSSERSDHSNCLSAPCREPEGDGVAHARGFEAVDFHTGQVRLLVAVEIRKRKV